MPMLAGSTTLARMTSMLATVYGIAIEYSLIASASDMHVCYVCRPGLRDCPSTVLAEGCCAGHRNGVLHYCHSAQHVAPHAG